MMKYFLATFEIHDGEHVYQAAVIFAAETQEEAYRMADTEEYDPATDAGTFYFSFGGDGLTACKNRSCQEISFEQVKFLENTGLAYRK